MDRREHVFDVDLRVHSQQCHCCARARRAPHAGREALRVFAIVDLARDIVGEIHHVAPFALDLLVFALARLARRCPRIVGAPDALGEAAEGDQAREPGEAFEKTRIFRLVPVKLDVRHPAGNVDEVERPVARDLAGDVHPAASRMPGTRDHRCNVYRCRPCCHAVRGTRRPSAVGSAVAGSCYAAPVVRPAEAMSRHRYPAFFRAHGPDLFRTRSAA